MATTEENDSSSSLEVTDFSKSLGSAVLPPIYYRDKPQIFINSQFFLEEKKIETHVTECQYGACLSELS